MQKPFTVATLLVFLVLEKKQEVKINNCHPASRRMSKLFGCYCSHVEERFR